jgi:hypothetical protein
MGNCADARLVLTVWAKIGLTSDAFWHMNVHRCGTAADSHCNSTLQTGVIVVELLRCGQSEK